MMGLLESMIQARETCEGVAYRGHRMLEQVTAEFKSFKAQSEQQQAAMEEQLDLYARLAKVRARPAGGGAWGGGGAPPQPQRPVAAGCLPGTLPAPAVARRASQPSPDSPASPSSPPPRPPPPQENGVDPEAVASELRDKEALLRQQAEQLATMEHVYTEMMAQVRAAARRAAAAAHAQGVLRRR
jgi:hypothetical protein